VNQVPEFEDKDFLSRAAQGDREAFGALYEQYVERIFNYVYYRTATSMTPKTLPPVFFIAP